MSRRKSKKPPTALAKAPVRNPVAANPLLGKSQAHGKTRKAIRRTDKVSLSKMSFERIACAAAQQKQALGSNDIMMSALATRNAHRAAPIHTAVACSRIGSCVHRLTA